jgi:hypothetical protein
VPEQPTLFHGDPDVELLLFPHLYSHGYGHFIKGECGENGRSTYTCHMDIICKTEFNYSDYCIIIFIVLVGSIETNILSGVRPTPMLLIWW